MKYFDKLFGRNNIRLIPQNLNKRSRPAALLRKYNLSADNLKWFMGKNREEYLGFMISQKALEYNDIREWFLSRIKNHNANVKRIHNVVIVIESKTDKNEQLI